MGKFRGLDTDIGWIKREFADIKQQIRELSAAKRLASSTVGNEGSLLVRGILRVIGAFNLTGTMSMESSDGVELVRIGDMTFGRGMEIKRDDQSVAFSHAKTFVGSARQRWVWLDRNGAEVLAEDSSVGGLSKPYLEHRFQPIYSTSGTAVLGGPYGIERSTTSATFETLFVYDGKRQNGFLDLKVAAVCSDGTTAGEVQVVDLATGTPLPGFFVSSWLGAIPAGTTTLTVLDPTPDQMRLNGFTMSAQMRLGLQVRRTAGAGTITVAIAQAIGG